MSSPLKTQQTVGPPAALPLSSSSSVDAAAAAATVTTAGARAPAVQTSVRAGLDMQVPRVQAHCATVASGGTRMGAQAAIYTTACVEAVLREIARKTIERVADGSHKRITPADIEAVFHATPHLRNNLGRLHVPDAHLHTAVAAHNTVEAVRARRVPARHAKAHRPKAEAAPDDNAADLKSGAASRRQKSANKASRKRKLAERDTPDNGDGAAGAEDDESAASTASVATGSAASTPLATKKKKKASLERAKLAAATAAADAALDSDFDDDNDHVDGGAQPHSDSYSSE